MEDHPLYKAGWRKRRPESSVWEKEKVLDHRVDRNLVDGVLFLIGAFNSKPWLGQEAGDFVIVEVDLKPKESKMLFRVQEEKYYPPCLKSSSVDFNEVLP